MYVTIFYVVFILNFYYFSCTANECNTVINNEYTANYHLRPPCGWMNDPNGFCYYGGLYHQFYQHNPFSSLEPGIANWRHATSADLFHWVDNGIIMRPDEWYDRSGVFSGSTLVDNNTMYLYYTGNVNYPDETPDHVQHQALTVSGDGVNFEKYIDNPIISGSTQLPNIRDPKVWKKDDTYYMVLGVSYENDTRGAAVLYASEDKVSWQEVSILAKSDGSLGFMWECPDFYELNGFFVLAFCPQEYAVPQENGPEKLYFNGYYVGTFDYTSRKFTNLTKFRQLDSGHDFYAMQTTQNSRGERIMTAWLDMWEINYAERIYGVTGQMILPRKLTLTPSKTLLQTPVKEVLNVRGKQIYYGKCHGGTTVTLNNNSAVIYIKANNLMNFELHLQSDNSSTDVVISYVARTKCLSLNRGGNDGIRKTTWKPTGKLRWTVFIDSSSVELFAGEGEVTMSSRMFPTGLVKVRLGNNTIAEDMKIYNMKRSVYLNDN